MPIRAPEIMSNSSSSNNNNNNNNKVEPNRRAVIPRRVSDMISNYDSPSPPSPSPSIASSFTSTTSSSSSSSFPMRSSSAVPGRNSNRDTKKSGTSSSNDRERVTNSISSSEEPFPVKLHRLLTEAERKGDEDVVGWNDDGTAFSILQPKVFAETWMKKYFLQTRYKSFQRQCNLYNFERTTLGKVKGHYSHPLFLRNDPSLCIQIKRDRAPGTALQQALSAKSAREKKKIKETGQSYGRVEKAISLSSRKSQISVNEMQKSEVGLASKSNLALGIKNNAKDGLESGFKKKKKSSRKVSIRNTESMKTDNRGELPQHQVSPTGVDAGLFERQVVTLEDDGTGFGGVPEILLDPLNCLASSDVRCTRSDFSLTRRDDAFGSVPEELEDRFGMGFFNLDDTKDDEDDACSIFTISDVPVDESPTINDLNDLDMTNNLSELVSEVVDDTISSVTPPSSICDSTVMNVPDGDSVRPNTYAPPISPRNDNECNSPTQTSFYYRQHQHHHQHFGQYSTYAGPATPFHYSPRHPHHVPSSLVPVTHHFASHPLHYSHHRPMYYSRPIGPLPSSLYHHAHN